MNKFLKAIGAGGLVTLLAGACNLGPTTQCIDCSKLDCAAKQVDAFCRVEITVAAGTNAACETEHVFGYCITPPDGGLPPNTNVSSWLSGLFAVLIKPMIAKTFGNNVGFDILQCTVGGGSNPFPVMTNTYKSPLGKISIEPADAGIRLEDEAACEACAKSMCDLSSCGADANCSCWVLCAFSDPTLASCGAMCGPQGGVTTALVSCLDTACGSPCGVPGSTPICGKPTTGDGAGGTSTTTSTTTCTLQQGGQDCATDADCCSGQCVDGYPSGTCT